MEQRPLEIHNIEPIVVDLTINHDYPEISVRMPIYKLEQTHELLYLELRYKVLNGRLSYDLNLSPQLLHTLYSAQTQLADLPLMQPDQMPHSFTLGTIDDVYMTVKKLKDFHDHREWQKHLGQYLKV